MGYKLNNPENLNVEIIISLLEILWNAKTKLHHLYLGNIPVPMLKCYGYNVKSNVIPSNTVFSRIVYSLE